MRNLTAIAVALLATTALTGLADVSTVSPCPAAEKGSLSFAAEFITLNCELSRFVVDAVDFGRKDVLE